MNGGLPYISNSIYVENKYAAKYFLFSLNLPLNDQKLIVNNCSIFLTVPSVKFFLN